MKRIFQHAWKALLAASVLLLLACLGGLAASPRSFGAGDGPGRPAGRAAAAELAVPFQVGERLDYRVSWEKFLTAATARVTIPERRAFYGKAAWHFQATARTVEPVRFLYTLDDQFDSYSDANTLASLQYEAYLRESGKNEDQIVRMGSEGEPPAGNGPTARVPPGTRDPLGAFFSLRAVDWDKTPEARMPVYDGKKLYELRARHVGPAESVTVPAGEFSAMRIELRVFERNRELAGTRFQLWLSRDPARTPVLIEAELPFGALRVELTRRE